MRGRNVIGSSRKEISFNESEFCEKSHSGSKMVFSLSFTPFSNPGRLDRISALEFDFPGI